MLSHRLPDSILMSHTEFKLLYFKIVFSFSNTLMPALDTRTVYSTQSLRYIFDNLIHSNSSYLLKVYICFWHITFQATSSLITRWSQSESQIIFNQYCSNNQASGAFPTLSSRTLYFAISKCILCKVTQPVKRSRLHCMTSFSTFSLPLNSDVLITNKSSLAIALGPLPWKETH